MIGVLCLLKCPRKFEANGGFTLRVASPQQPPFVLPRRPLFPSMRATGASPELVVGATPPLMASRRRQGRAAAAPILAEPTTASRALPLAPLGPN